MDAYEDKLQFEAAALLIEIEDLKGVTQKVVKNVISRVNLIFESYLAILSEQFKTICGPNDALSIVEISNVLNSYVGQNVFEGVQTRKKLDLFIESYQGLVMPEKVVLLRKEVLLKGSLRMVPIEWGYFIPFLPSLEKLLSCPETLHCVDNPLPHVPGVFKTPLDGGFYQNHPLVKKDPLTLGVGIYADGAEVTDTASTKSGLHGLTFVYWVLFNVHPDKRSSLRSVFLLAVVKSTWLKRHGYDKLLKDFIDGINQLSSSGVTFNLKGVTRHFHGLFICSSGDNPGSANLAGFKESASFSNKPCRQCYASQDNLYHSFKESDFELRSKDRHLAELQEIESYCAATADNPQHPSVRYGINRRSALMAIEGCDVTKCFPQDVMHDCLEGTLKLDMCCTLNHVLEKKRMTIVEINQRIKMFSKFVGVNKPANLEAHHIANGKLRLTAAEAWNLAYILPFVLRKKNFRTGKFESVCDKKNQLLYILRLNLMDLLLSDEARSVDVMHIRHITEVHHKLFQELYPGKEIPKMHFEIHMATHILLFGVPKQYWCMRYEGKHAFFKRLWRLYRSLKDHAGTLARAHQRKQGGLMLLSSFCGKGPFLKTSDSCGAPRSKLVKSLSRKARAVLPELSADETLQQFKVVTVKGVQYRKGSAIIASFHHQPVFGKVVYLLKVGDELVFVYQKLDTVEFVKNLNSFKVKHSSDFCVMKASDLPYNHKLFLIQQVASCYIVVPCRSYLDSQDFHQGAMA